MKLLDVAPGPMIAIPIAIIVGILAAIGLIVLAVILIARSRNKDK